MMARARTGVEVGQVLTKKSAEKELSFLGRRNLLFFHIFKRKGMSSAGASIELPSFVISCANLSTRLSRLHLLVRLRVEGAEAYSIHIVYGPTLRSFAFNNQKIGCANADVSTACWPPSSLRTPAQHASQTSKVVTKTRNHNHHSNHHHHHHHHQIYPHLSRQSPVAIAVQHSKSSTRILSAHLCTLNCSAAMQIIQQVQKLAAVNGIRAICVKSKNSCEKRSEIAATARCMFAEKEVT